MKYEVALSLMLLVGCSKGGVGPGPGGQTCRSISDPDPGTGMMMDTPLPKALYAELKEAVSGKTLPIMLEGIGGSYSGQSAAFGKCDPPGNYFVERLALVDAAGGAVATAVRSGSSYVITYARGGSTTVSTSGFTRYYTNYAASTSSSIPSLMSVSSSGMSRQGDKLTVTSAAMAPADDCGMREVQWYLVTSSGSMASPAASVTIPGDSGMGQMKIPADLTPTTYYLEGRLTTKTGRYSLIRRQSTTDSTYSLYNPVSVTANASADRTVPQPVSMDAMPAKVARCGVVTLTLKLTDDIGLPSSQMVPFRIGPLSQPTLLRATFMGSDTVSGPFTVPNDAPGGIWVSYPESVVDAAGNIGTGSLSADKFTIDGAGVTTPREVQAATFLVDVPGTGPSDLGFTPPPDLSGTFADMRQVDGPAMITNISVTPTSAVVDMPVTVTVTWSGAGLK